MRIGRLALALALCGSLSGVIEAKAKPAVHRVSARKATQPKPRKIKPRKAKRVKARPKRTA